jgi:glycosyltransferase involved in cell wall biosynthesis
MAGNPLVSVCIPVYRGRDYIGAAIESVLGQTLHDFELIVIDNASDDGTYDRAASYQDSRLRCLRNPTNIGALGNWNRCLREASGQYIKILPHDDLLAPGCLARQAAVFESDTRHEIALVCCARDIIDPNDRRLLQPRPLGRAARRLDARQVFRRCLHRGTNVLGEPGSVLFRRDAAERAGDFDAAFPFVIDLDYYLRLLEFGDAAYIPEALASFRIAPTQWSVGLGRSQAAEFSALAAKMAGRPYLAASRLDLMAGGIVAHANNVARLLIYKFMFGSSEVTGAERQGSRD